MLRRLLLVSTALICGLISAALTLRIVRNMMKAGHAFCVAGNHDVKLLRWLRGKQVQVKHGLEQSILSLEAVTPEDKGKSSWA